MGKIFPSRFFPPERNLSFPVGIHLKNPEKFSNLKAKTNLISLPLSLLRKQVFVLRQAQHERRKVNDFNTRTLRAVGPTGPEAVHPACPERGRRKLRRRVIKGFVQQAPLIFLFFFLSDWVREDWPWAPFFREGD